MFELYSRAVGEVQKPIHAEVYYVLHIMRQKPMKIQVSPSDYRGINVEQVYGVNNALRDIYPFRGVTLSTHSFEPLCRTADSFFNHTGIALEARLILLLKFLSFRLKSL